MSPSLPASEPLARQRLRVTAAVCAVITAIVAIIVGEANASYQVLASIGLAGLLLTAYVLWPARALLAFAAYALLSETIAHYAGPAAKSVDEIAVPCFFALAAVRGKVWRRLEIRWWREGALVALALLGVASSVVNAVPVAVWIPAAGLLLKGVALYYVVSWQQFSAADLRLFGGALFAAAALIVSLGFIELLNPPLFQQILGLPEYARIRGGIPSIKSVFFHPVLFGWFTAFAAIFAFAAYHVYRRWWMLALGLVLTLGTVLSGRRKPLAGLAAAVAAAVMWTRGEQRSVGAALKGWLPVAIGGIAIFILFLPLFTSLYGVTLDRYIGSEQPEIVPGSNPDSGTSTSGTFTPARIALYTTSVRIAADEFPFGAGLGRFGSWMSRVNYSPVYVEYGLSGVQGLRERNPSAATDTFWPMILGETGVGGLIAYAVFFGGLFLSVSRSLHRSQDSPAVRAFKLGTLMVMVEAMLESLAAPSLIAPPVAYFVFGTAGIVSSFERARRLTALSTATNTIP